jgi:hypothetical protein
LLPTLFYVMLMGFWKAVQFSSSAQIWWWRQNLAATFVFAGGRLLPNHRITARPSKLFARKTNALHSALRLAA